MTAVWAKRKAKASDPDAMDLLAKVIRLNPDSYSLWNYRREAVLSLLSQIGDEQPANGAAVAGIYQTELSLAAAAIRRNPKSYATWHHRRWALERGLEAVGGADALDRELELCTQLLELDARNFHCWRHRKWAVRLRGLPVAEDFAFTTGKIAQNFSNYSAFHHRSELLPFVAAERGSQEGRWQLLAEELDMAHQAMYTEPADQSAWWYHQFLIRWAGAGCPVAASPAPAPAAAAAADVPLAATSGPTTAFGAEAKDGNGGSSGDNCGDENSSGGEPEDGAGTVERYEAVLHAEAACMRELVELDDGGKWPTLTLLSLLLLLSKRAQAARSAAAGSDGGGGCGGGGGDISCGAAAGTAGAAGAERERKREWRQLQMARWQLRKKQHGRRSAPS
ncbi:unnamed protein product [Phaeothamnion confervicola]